MAPGVLVMQRHREVVAPMTLHIVHDPDTGCGSCPLEYQGEVVFSRCHALTRRLMEHEMTPAPPWCPLRAGDVVVTARKDGG